MEKEDVKKIIPGLYKIIWKGCDGFSIAAVGILGDGGRWLAPTNWQNPTNKQHEWEAVESVELIRIQHEIPDVIMPKIQKDYDRIISEKLQTQYEWKKERLSSIKIRPSDFGGYSSNEIESLKKEELGLIEWLKANKPSNWAKCSRGNTKIVGTIWDINSKK